MKRLIYPTLILFTLSLWSCKKLVSFNMNYNDTVTIPANSLINIPFNLVTPQTTTNSQQTFESNGTGANLITKIALTGLDISILTPTNANFNFLKSVEIFLSAPDLNEVRVAYNLDVPATDLQHIDLTCEDTDLKEYLKKSTYSIRVKATTDENLTQDVDVNVHSKFTVDAGLL